jgi:hypothetical protein
MATSRNRRNLSVQFNILSAYSSSIIYDPTMTASFKITFPSVHMWRDLVGFCKVRAVYAQAVELHTGNHLRRKLCAVSNQSVAIYLPAVLQLLFNDVISSDFNYSSMMLSVRNVSSGLFDLCNNNKKISVL